MTLTSEYQYVGRSNAVQDQNYYQSYYLLLYAKTSGDVAAGRHTVRVKLRLASTSTNHFYGYSTIGSISIAGTAVDGWSWENVPDGSSDPWVVDHENGGAVLTESGVSYRAYVDLREGSLTVNTGYGTEKDISIAGSWMFVHDAAYGYLPQRYVEAAVTATVTLPAVAGMSMITTAGNVTLGGSCSVKWTPLTASLAYKLRFAMGNWSDTTGVISPGRTTEYTYSDYAIPLDAAYQIPNDPTGIMTVTLYTYLDSSCGTLLGEDSENFTVTVPNNANTQPEPGMSLSAVSALGSAFSGLFVQGYTKLAASFAGTGKYGASVVSYEMRVVGKTYGDPYVSDYLTQTETITVTGTAVDSRGYPGTVTQQITVIPYDVPKIQVSVCGRCDAGGNLTDSGTYLKIQASRVYNKVEAGGAQKNFCTIRYRYKLESGKYSQWDTILPGSDLSTDTVTTGALLGSLSASSTYTVQISAIDDVGNKGITTFTLLTEAVFMHRRAGGKGMGLGKYCEEDNLLDVAWNLRVRGDILVGDSGITLEEYIKSFLS